MSAKMLKEDDDGYIVIISQKEYDEYVIELEKWLEENQDKIDEKRLKEKPIKKFYIE